MTKESGAEANQYKIAHSPCMDLVAHENSSIVCMIDANFGGETEFFIISLVNSLALPYALSPS